MMTRDVDDLMVGHDAEYKSQADRMDTHLLTTAYQPCSRLFNLVDLMGNLSCKPFKCSYVEGFVALLIIAAARCWICKDSSLPTNVSLMFVDQQPSCS